MPHICFNLLAHCSVFLLTQSQAVMGTCHLKLTKSLAIYIQMVLIYYLPLFPEDVRTFLLDYGKRFSQN